MKIENLIILSATLIAGYSADSLACSPTSVVDNNYLATSIPDGTNGDSVSVTQPPCSSDTVETTGSYTYTNDKFTVVQAGTVNKENTNFAILGADAVLGNGETQFTQANNTQTLKQNGNSNFAAQLVSGNLNIETTTQTDPAGQNIEQIPDNTYAGNFLYTQVRGNHNYVSDTEVDTTANQYITANNVYAVYGVYAPSVGYIFNGTDENGAGNIVKAGQENYINVIGDKNEAIVNTSGVRDQVVSIIAGQEIYNPSLTATLGANAFDPFTSNITVKGADGTSVTFAPVKVAATGYGVDNVTNYSDVITTGNGNDVYSIVGRGALPNSQTPTNYDSLSYDGEDSAEGNASVVSVQGPNNVFTSYILGNDTLSVAAVLGASNNIEADTYMQESLRAPVTEILQKVVVTGNNNMLNSLVEGAPPAANASTNRDDTITLLISNPDKNATIKDPFPDIHGNVNMVNRPVSSGNTVTNSVTGGQNPGPTDQNSAFISVNGADNTVVNTILGVQDNSSITIAAKNFNIVNNNIVNQSNVYADGNTFSVTVNGTGDVVTNTISGNNNIVQAADSGNSFSATRLNGITNTISGNNNRVSEDVLGSAFASKNESLTLTVAGDSNKVTEILSANGDNVNDTITQYSSNNTIKNTISTANNTVTDTITGQNNFNLTQTISGTGNTITNSITGGNGIYETITEGGQLLETVSGSKNTISNTLVNTLTSINVVTEKVSGNNNSLTTDISEGNGTVTFKGINVLGNQDVVNISTANVAYTGETVPVINVSGNGTHFTRVY